MQDAIQAQIVIQKMSELTTQESTDDLEPISESPSKTLDEGQEESSSENDETLEEEEDDLKQNNAKNNEQTTLDSANANNVQFQTDNENNIPVSAKSRIPEEPRLPLKICIFSDTDDISESCEFFGSK